MDSGATNKSLFNVNSNKVLELIDDAWAKKGNSYLNKGNDVFEIFMDGDVVGTAGETYIRVVTKSGTNEIISAYPILASKVKP